MQQPPQINPDMPSFPPTNISTEKIQMYLEDNKKLILAIMENQNQGKLAKRSQCLAQLQKNLMYLTAIADAQPQAPRIAPQQGAYHMQHPEAAMALARQPGVASPEMPIQFTNPDQMQDPEQQMHPQNQQGIQGHLGLRSIGVSNSIQPWQVETTTIGGPRATVPVPNDQWGGRRQDASEAANARADEQGSSSGGTGAADGANEWN